VRNRSTVAPASPTTSSRLLLKPYRGARQATDVRLQLEGQRGSALRHELLLVAHIRRKKALRGDTTCERGRVDQCCLSPSGVALHGYRAVKGRDVPARGDSDVEALVPVVYEWQWARSRRGEG